jgi:hypothetical protein
MSAPSSTRADWFEGSSIRRLPINIRSHHFVAYTYEFVSDDHRCELSGMFKGEE